MLSTQRDTRTHTMVCLHVQNVPNFTYILIHTGNTDEHTSGCLIVGESQQDLDISADGFIGSSAVAYKKMYSKVANQLLQGKKVTIKYNTIIIYWRINQ